eukprot:6251401-Amphidinium_carterae.2
MDGELDINNMEAPLKDNEKNIAGWMQTLESFWKELPLTLAYTPGGRRHSAAVIDSGNNLMCPHFRLLGCYLEHMKEFGGRHFDTTDDKVMELGQTLSDLDALIAATTEATATLVDELSASVDGIQDLGALILHCMCTSCLNSAPSAESVAFLRTASF